MASRRDKRGEMKDILEYLATPATIRIMLAVSSIGMFSCCAADILLVSFSPLHLSSPSPHLSLSLSSYCPCPLSPSSPLLLSLLPSHTCENICDRPGAQMMRGPLEGVVVGRRGLIVRIAEEQNK